MSKMKSIVDAISSKLSISRRSFIKATLVVGGSAAIVGCEKGSGEPIFVGGGSGLDNVISPEDLSNAKIYHAGCVHNCGTGERCVSKLHVVNGKVVRVTSDDSDYDYEGIERDRLKYNDSRALSCAKGRAYKYKLYHPGRLKYTLKQTKARGDMSGFVRMNSEEAMKEVINRYRAIYTKYGRAAIYNSYGSSAGYGGTFSNASDARNALTTFIGGVKSNYSNYSFHQNIFSYQLTGHPGTHSSATALHRSLGNQLPNIAGVVKNIVAWGSNTLSTNNSVSWGYVRAVEMMKERNQTAKVYFIGPEFVDTAVTCATDWVQLRNYTDTALIMALFHEMIINTVNPDGSIVAEPWLDLEYIDTMVYGFFDSPAYNINETTGVITVTTAAAGSGERKVQAVPAGKSLSAYVMGSDDRLTKLKYNVSKNYTATQYGNISRNLSTSTYPSDTNSKYYYKQDMSKAKTPEWASEICGTKVETIRELARMYCDPAQHPILSEFAGGVQKSDNGVISLFSIATLLCVTKTFGLNGEGLFVGVFGTSIASNGDIGADTDYLAQGAAKAILPTMYKDKQIAASMSCKEWFNGIKFAFHDELIKNTDYGKHIPEWDGKTRYVNDDGATKAGIKYKYASNPLAPSLPEIFTEDGLPYYKYEGQTGTTPASGTPIYTGIRMIVNSGGNIPANQHENTNDSVQMFKTLPISKSDDIADSFCLATFDIYMSPTARYADYVFASTVALEAGDWMSIGGEPHYRPGVSKAPGEAKDGWRYAYEAYKAQAGLDSFNGVDAVDAHFKYVGTTSTYQSSDVKSLIEVDRAIADVNSRFYGMTRDEVFEKQYRPRKSEVTEVQSDERAGAYGELLRDHLDQYLALGDTMSTTPFVYNNNDYPNTVIDNGNDSNGDPIADTIIPGNYANANVAGQGPNVARQGDWGTGEANIAEWGDGTRPNFTGKFHVYNGAMVWDYARRYSKWHGWLPKEQRGQKNKDYEGDPIVYPIPMYMDFRDGFNETYGVFPIKDLEGNVVKDGKPENDLSKNRGLTLSTTHDRYRVHSTNAENPLLRELNHRTKGGGYGSGNDWKEYAVMPDRHVEGATAPISPMISSAVYKKDMKTASWHEIWINDQDAADRGIKENDLIVVENPIGAVRVIARLTKRCMRGHINLHQGGWYDPNPIDGIDDGGCANTLMSSKPSRIDNGNAQQSAYVTVRKDTLFV